MKILIAVGSKEFSGPTLRAGMKIARAFDASATIIDVGAQLSSFNTNIVDLAHERMESWDFHRSGVEVLEWAFNYLAEHRFIEPQVIEAGFSRHTLVKTSSSRWDLYLKGTVCKDLNLVLRTGDIIAELREEVHAGQYDVTIIGGSQKRRMGHDLIQYIDSSIFIVNQYDFNKKYRVLLAVDDSRGTWKAVSYGARVARAFDVGVDILTVSKKDHFGPGYRAAAEQAAKFMRRAKIQFESHFKVGDPATVIKAEAGHNHMIVMGSSSRSPLAKFFTGSKPLKVMEDCHCPVLIVK
ncbi:MAG: universal stress protein [Fidelibacterota bacterium]